jgi:hypothetical protein
MSADGQLPRRRFLTGVGAAALTIPAVQAGTGAATATAATAATSATAASAGGGQPGGSPFPPVPGADTTTTQDRQQMLWQLGMTEPTLPARADDPNRPPNVTPMPAYGQDVYSDPLGHYVTRSSFGQWNTYDDSTGAAGGAQSPAGPYGPDSTPRYPDIPLLLTTGRRVVRTPTDWWVRRRPEILRQVEENLYGRIPPRELWPAISWSAGPPATGTANGVAYVERAITGTIDTSGFPGLRNAPVIQATLRIPRDTQGQPVPVMIVIGGNNSEWQFTAPYGYGVCGFNPVALQPDSGGANMSSYIIGLISRGNWRRPADWGALAAWSWGISRLIDYFETDPDVDATRIGLQGISRYGKATLVAAAYDTRIGAAFPSDAGELGTSWARRTWGETFEIVFGGDTEYHWVCGAGMRYLGELHPGTYWPRAVWNLPVDAHSVMSLIAPRVVMTNGGQDIPPGFGDAWTDPRGMYLAGAISSPVWELLGWPGQVIPPGTVFTSGAGEAPGGTPPVDVAFIDGTVGYRRHHEGHTAVPDWPSFMQLTARHFNDSRPVIAPGQRFAVRFADGRPREVLGTIKATDPDSDPLGNWQITGGTGAYIFAVDPATGQLTLRDPDLLPRRGGRREYTLTVVVDDRKLPSHEETIMVTTR